MYFIIGLKLDNNFISNVDYVSINSRMNKIKINDRDNPVLGNFNSDNIWFLLYDTNTKEQKYYTFDEVITFKKDNLICQTIEWYTENYYYIYPEQQLQFFINNCQVVYNRNRGIDFSEFYTGLHTICWDIKSIKHWEIKGDWFYFRLDYSWKMHRIKIKTDVKQFETELLCKYMLA